MPDRIKCDHCEGFADDHDRLCLFQYPNPDQDDWEWSGQIEHHGVDYRVRVTKLGGGRVGSWYAGSWYIKIVNVDAPGGQVEVMNDRLTTGTVYTHELVGRQALHFLPEQV